MNIIKIQRIEDFGEDYYIRLLTVGKYSLVTFIFSWSNWSSGPYFQIAGGLNSIFYAMFWIGRLGLEVRILDQDYRIKN